MPQFKLIAPIHGFQKHYYMLFTTNVNFLLMLTPFCTSKGGSGCNQKVQLSFNETC